MPRQANIYYIINSIIYIYNIHIHVLYISKIRILVYQNVKVRYKVQITIFFAKKQKIKDATF